MRARRPDAVPRPFVRARGGRAAARRRAERQRQDQPPADPVRPPDTGRRRGALERRADPRAARGLLARAPLPRACACGEGRPHAAREPGRRVPPRRNAGAPGSADLGAERLRGAGSAGAQALAGAAAPRGARATAPVGVGGAVAARRAVRRPGHRGGELHRRADRASSRRGWQRGVHDAPAGRHRCARARGPALIFPAVKTIVRRDLLLALRRRSDVATAPLGVVVSAKTLAHWLVSGLPLVLIAPLIALQYDVEAGLYGVLALSLLLGTPVLSIIGAIGAALTLGLRGGGVLLSLLVLPLYVPVLILGAGSVEMAAAGLSPEGQLLLLGAMLIVAAVFAPWATAAALRISSE